MSRHPTRGLISTRATLRSTLSSPAILAFLPALTLGAYWLGGEMALMATALMLPLAVALVGGFSEQSGQLSVPRDSVTGLLLRDGFDCIVEQVFELTSTSGHQSAMFLLELDDFKQLTSRHGQAAADEVMNRAGERIASTLRNDDSVARYGDCRFAVCLMPVRQLDLELCIQLAARLQSAVEEPISIDGTSLYMSCSIGFCLRSRSPGKTGTEWISATATALDDAQRNGPSAIRAYSADMQRKEKTRSSLREEVASALNNGQIQPWYQPQISTDTGKVTGFEALARWTHPERGMISPDEFLPIIEEMGLLERLAEVMMYHALTAIKAWDSAGMNVPQVAVNFAGPELANPHLVEKVKWELDRFELAPDRLAIEVLETVVAESPDDTISLNINGLGKLGCQIDLDDFGTGHASIASIRRFSISRIKIDRSFVMKADRDPEQQRMIGAILTMAERLNLETLAEGVETVGEHALLAQLGCGHVQGFGIARPMPFDHTLDWITAHVAKLVDPPRISGKAR
ncbi:MAG: bifunctional diguanylate cyclase/phosphodiesterase [Paracoccaceae bacterium]